MACKGKLHALAHLFRMNRGRVYSWTDSVSGAHMIGFRCDGCGDYDMIYGHQGLIERNGGQGDIQSIYTPASAIMGCKKKPKGK